MINISSEGYSFRLYTFTSKIVFLVSVLMLMRLLICTSILDGVRALWRLLNNILLNLIVGDVFPEQ